MRKSQETLGGFIQEQLGMENARFVLPNDLVAIGLAVWAADEPLIMAGDREKYARVATDLLREKVGVNLSPDDYLELIGRGHYREGTVAQAIINAKEQIGEEDYRRLRESFSVNLGEALYLQWRYPGKPIVPIGNPGVRYIGNILSLAEIRYIMQRRPNLTIEYGPGLVFARKIPVEVWLTPQTIAIEGGDPDIAQYKIDALANFAWRLGIVPPQLILRRDGIKSATAELLSYPENHGIADLVIASAVGVAGEEEIRAGIEAAHQLLAPGGVLALKGRETEEEGYVGISQMVEMAREVFGEPQLRRDITVRLAGTGKIVSGQVAVFEK